MKKVLLLYVLMLTVLLGVPLDLHAQTSMGTAFTYQGRLTDGGSPANGQYDLEFRLYKNSAGTDPVGDPIPVEDEDITNGLSAEATDVCGRKQECAATPFIWRCRPQEKEVVP